MAAVCNLYCFMSLLGGIHCFLEKVYSKPIELKIVWTSEGLAEFKSEQECEKSVSQTCFVYNSLEGRAISLLAMQRSQMSRNRMDSCSCVTDLRFWDIWFQLSTKHHSTSCDAKGATHAPFKIYTLKFQIYEHSVTSLTVEEPCRSHSDFSGRCVKLQACKIVKSDYQFVGEDGSQQTAGDGQRKPKTCKVGEGITTRPPNHQIRLIPAAQTAQDQQSEPKIKVWCLQLNEHLTTASYFCVAKHPQSWSTTRLQYHQICLTTASQSIQEDWQGRMIYTACCIELRTAPKLSEWSRNHTVPTLYRMKW